jgi:AcrR family transcriptional regulator
LGIVYTGSVPCSAAPNKRALNCLEKVAVAFRKVGRPPEDRLCRQREIYLAVAPLLRCSGVRGLSMRAAARAAYVSVGGLYCYFPTKRDLVLHGLQPEAIARYCHDKVSAFAHLAETDPAAFSKAILDHFHALVVGFVLPAYDAAVELGAETARAQVHRTLEGSLGEARSLLWPLVPHLDEAGVVPLGEGLLRLALSVLLYRATPPEQFRRDLDALITGYSAQHARPAPS